MNNRKAPTWEDHEREMREKGYLTPEFEAEIRAEADRICADIDRRNALKASRLNRADMPGGFAQVG